MESQPLTSGSQPQACQGLRLESKELCQGLSLPTKGVDLADGGGAGLHSLPGEELKQPGHGAGRKAGQEPGVAGRIVGCELHLSVQNQVDGVEGIAQVEQDLARFEVGRRELGGELGQVGLAQAAQEMCQPQPLNHVLARHAAIVACRCLRRRTPML